MEIEKPCCFSIFSFLFFFFFSISQMYGFWTSKVAQLCGTQKVLGVRNARISYVIMDVTILVPWFLRGVMCFVNSNKLGRLLAPGSLTYWFLEKKRKRLPNECSTTKLTRHGSVRCEVDVCVTHVTLVLLWWCLANIVRQLSLLKAIETLAQFRRKYKHFGTKPRGIWRIVNISIMKFVRVANNSLQPKKSCHYQSQRNFTLTKTKT